VIPQEKQVAIFAARIAGKSYRAIAEELGVSKETVVKYVREHQERIDAEMYANLDERFRTLGILKTERIESTARLLTLIQESIRSETVAELSTKDMILLHMKLIDSLEKQIGSVKLLAGKKYIPRGNLVNDEVEQNYRLDS
jgi:transposase-like protein